MNFIKQGITNGIQTELKEQSIQYWNKDIKDAKQAIKSDSTLENILKQYNTLGISYYMLATTTPNKSINCNLAIEYLLKALKLSNDKKSIADISNIIGKVYMWHKNRGLAVDYFRDELKIRNELSPILNLDKALAMEKIAHCFRFGEQHRSAITKYLEVLSMVEKIPQTNPIPNEHIQLAYNCCTYLKSCYKEINDLEKSKKYAEEMNAFLLGYPFLKNSQTFI